jgi:murein DD-endopeptidase MepM/ murein hydrolase activator NlpD
LVADESVNYAYPWRDNFCEHRYFFVGDCPSGLGHQGQDIRPSSCTQRIEGANRCEPYQHDVVAARDGIVLRAPGEIALYIVTNTVNERVRFRYLHMLPKYLDQDRMVSGRVVHEGEAVGKVGNFFRRERATTYHLHFDIQVPTKYGWVFVNPYMSLVAAYERTIQGRGRELLSDGTPIVTGSALPGSALPVSALPAAALPAAALPAAALPSSTLPGPTLPRPALSSPAAAFNVIPAIPAPAANPIEIEVESSSLNRFTSDTAGYARQRSDNW